MNYPNLPNSNLKITSQPEVKEITNELLKQLLKVPREASKKQRIKRTTSQRIRPKYS
ncbi:hypothetical protein [Helicobacter pylori]|uniref:hypothetical protein n=1 Tax=Helicobacter pylori TaxID=210 RepID=UPI001E538DDC|nr:hypothetical protein [Helicobacter pylori]